MTTITNPTHPNVSALATYGDTVPASGGTLAGAPFEYPAKTILWLSWDFCFAWANHVGLQYSHKYNLREICIKRGVKVGFKHGAPSRKVPVDRVTFEQFLTGYMPVKSGPKRRIYRTRASP